MLPLFLLFFSALLILALYKICQSLLNRRRRDAKAKELGCLPAPTLRSNNFLGTSRLKDSMKANKENRGPQYVIDAMNELGVDVHTCRVPVFDYELLVDCKSISL